MILVDTAPLVSLLDVAQGETHTRCVRLYSGLPKPLMTTWCSLTEAMYLLHRAEGWSAQQRLWQIIERQALLLHTSSLIEQQRIYQLMEQYQDVPMDLADASLVAAAEVLGIRQIFTLDNDFHIYRLHGRDAFDVVG